MSETFDRYSLAIAVLDGEKDAHKILGDLLEERGQRGLAQWARSRKGKRRKKLEFVLAILPHETAILLACDFVGHLGDEKTLRLSRRVADAVRAGLGDSDSEASRQETDRQLRRLAAEAWKIGSASACVQSLAEAWEHAKLAEEYQGKRETKRFHHEVELTCLAVRRLARLAQQLANRRSQALWSRQGNRSAPDELHWQIEHTRQVLETLLDDETS